MQKRMSVDVINMKGPTNCIKMCTTVLSVWILKVDN